MSTITTATTGGTTAATDHQRPRTRALLNGAAVAGPLFYLSSLVQALVRPGFDIRVHPLSQLTTGDPGWIQQLSFVLAGVGILGLAVAHRRCVRTGIGARLVPVFLAIFGAGFIAAGVFRVDPQNGFPIGAPAGVAEMSWHSMVHSMAAVVAFLALAGATITLLVRSIRNRRGWAAVGHGLVSVVLMLPMSPTESSIQIALTGMIAFSWVTVVALRLHRTATDQA